MTDDMKIRWIVVVCREGAVQALTFSDEGSARAWEEQWGQQWSESFVCRVVKGPLTCSDPEPSPHEATLLSTVIDWLESPALRQKLHAWAQEHWRGRSETDTITDVLPILAGLLREGVGVPVYRVLRGVGEPIQRILRQVAQAPSPAEDGYPPGWPRCAGGCGRPALDGKRTCGDAACGPGTPP